MIEVPPSLDPAVRQRAFTARSGELGLRLADAGAFLDACDRDGLVVLGWEIWIVDHLPGEGFEGDPEPAPGRWAGSVPTRDGQNGIFHGSGDAAETRRELASGWFLESIDPRWLGPLRVNITAVEPAADGVA